MVKEDDKQFISALETGDINLLKTIPKAEKHCHMDLGGSLARFRELTKQKIKDPPQEYPNFSVFQDYILDELDPIFSTRKGSQLAKLNTIQQTKEDGITILEASIDDGFSYHYQDDYDDLINYLDQAIQNINPQLDFRPELGLGRTDDIADLERIAFFNINTGYFKSIDLYGNEVGDNPKKYIPIFRKAKEAGLKLKTHIGEFSSPAAIKETVELLELDEIQHGIQAAASKELMTYLADHDIILNICPTSNIKLRAVESIARHPIRTLFDHGVKVTVNTDDYLIFNSSLSEEFLLLYRARIFTAEELNLIRKMGLD